MEKKEKKNAGLGRCLSDLLDDNDGIPNMKSNVLLKREDGSEVKIYDKTGGKSSSRDGVSRVIKKS